jgi:hypothetical protein
MGETLATRSSRMTARNGNGRNGRKSFYEEAMETFHRAADLIGLNPRVRMEIE